MILGIGVDIIKIERFSNIKNPRFVARVFSEYEQEYLRSRKAQSYAAIFAAKEAVAKALGTGFLKFSPREIEIRHTKHGKPYIQMHGAARKIAIELLKNEIRKHAKFQAPMGMTVHNCTSTPLTHKKIKISISLSHSDTDAIAFAIIAI